MKEYILTSKELNNPVDINMLPGEIKGVDVIYHFLKEGKKVEYGKDENYLHMFFLIKGSLVFSYETKEYIYSEKALFIGGTGKDVTLTALSQASFVEIIFALTESDLKGLQDNKTEFPISVLYKDAVQYRDPFKSEKTISRMIVPHRIIPRFSMGSVETYGTDLIGQHEHPLLDQYFFTFPETKMSLLVDDSIITVEGNTLLHIPLGSNHGVRTDECGAAHYLWIDVVLTPEGDDYLDEVHKRTGTKRSF